MSDSVVDQVCIQTIDARGLACPLPLLKAKQGLSHLVPGQQLQVLATDSASVRDFHAFAALSCHSLEDFNESDGVYSYLFVKGIETSE